MYRSHRNSVTMYYLSYLRSDVAKLYLLSYMTEKTNCSNILLLGLGGISK